MLRSVALRSGHLAGAAAMAAWALAAAAEDWRPRGLEPSGVAEARRAAAEAQPLPPRAGQCTSLPDARWSYGCSSRDPKEIYSVVMDRCDGRPARKFTPSGDGWTARVAPADDPGQTVLAVDQRASEGEEPWIRFRVQYASARPMGGYTSGPGAAGWMDLQSSEWVCPTRLRGSYYLQELPEQDGTRDAFRASFQLLCEPTGETVSGCIDLARRYVYNPPRDTPFALRLPARVDPPPFGAQPDGFVSADDTELFHPDPPLDYDFLPSGMQSAYRIQLRPTFLHLGAAVRRGPVYGDWIHVSTQSAAGWVRRRHVIAASAVREATVFRTVKAWPRLPDVDGEGGTSVPSGTLLRVLGEDGADASVLLPGGGRGWISKCRLSFRPEDVAVARELAARAVAGAGTRPAAKIAPTPEVRALLASSRLAPLLKGKRIGPFECPPPPATAPADATGGAGVATRREVGPGGVEVLGIWQRAWQRSYPVDAPSIHDWRALAAKYGPVAPDRPLPRALQKKMEAQRLGEATAQGEERMNDLRPKIPFALPETEVAGAYYAFTAAGIERPSAVRLAGRILPKMDCDGCEQAPRELEGHAVLTLPESITDALAVWFPREIDLTDRRALPREAWRPADGTGPAQIELPLPSGGSRRFPVPNFYDAGAPFSITGERVTVLAGWLVHIPGGPTLLLLSTNGNPACDRGLYLYEVREEGLRTLGGTCFGCDL